MAGFAQTTKDSTRIAGSLTIDEVVVTGTRNETDIRHLPMTISVVNRKVLEQSFQPSVLPVLIRRVYGSGRRNEPARYRRQSYGRLAGAD